MNRAFCNTCGALVSARRDVRDGRVYLVKDCPTCGCTETMISTQAERFVAKQAFDPPQPEKACQLDCLDCDHGRKPGLVFLDLTNRCNLNCPICINNTPSMGYVFDPPFEYFETIFKDLSTFDPKPSIQLFGGEPTVRQDLFEIIACARSYGLATRLVTNGVRLADEAYCREVIQSKATILLSYDGANPETYRRLRGREDILEKKVQALDHIARIGGAKVTLMSMSAKGFNDHEFPEMLGFCHDRRQCIRAIYLMPLAETWDEADFDLKTERTTMEDVEAMVANAFPEDPVEFLPAGLLGQVSNLLAALKVKPPPFQGAHPNCESMSMLISDGEVYRSMGHYLKSPLAAVVRDVLAVDERLGAKRPGVGGRSAGRMARSLWRLRALRMSLGLVRRHARLGRLLRGRGLGQLWHALAVPLGFLCGRRSRAVFAAHTRVGRTLQLVVLPFEDHSTLETARLKRCPTAFAYYDPDQDRVRYVPTCAWNLHKDAAMRRIVAHYGAAPGT